MQPYYKDAQTMHRLEEDRLGFEQRGGNGTGQGTASPSAPPSVAPDDIVRPAVRDTPPPGCTAQEWDAAAPSLRVARWSAENDLLDLVTGRLADIEQVRERWRTNPARSTPTRFAKVTAAERAKSPSVSVYLDELALRLGLHQEDEPERRAI